MYAIVDIAGQQMKVQKGQEIYVHRLQEKEGTKVSFDKVLLISNEGKVTVGEPAVSGAQVSGKIIEHLKGDKVIVFKKKRRKGYKVNNGHRQYLSKIVIEEILESGAKPASKAEAAKTEAKKPAPAKAEETKKEAAPKAEAKKAETAAPKKEETPKAETKKAEPVKKEEAPKVAAEEKAKADTAAAKNEKKEETPVKGEENSEKESE